MTTRGCSPLSTSAVPKVSHSARRSLERADCLAGLSHQSAAAAEARKAEADITPRLAIQLLCVALFAGKSLRDNAKNHRRSKTGSRELLRAAAPF